MSLLQEQIDSTVLDQIRYYVFQDLQNLLGLSMDIQAMFDWLKNEADYDELKQVAMNKLITQVNLSNTIQYSLFEDYHDDQSLLKYLNETKEQAKQITKEFIQNTISNQFIQEQLRLYIDNNLSKILTIKQQNITPSKTTSGLTQNIVQKLIDSIDQVAMDLDSIKSNKSVNKFSAQELIKFCKQRYQNALTKVQQHCPKQMQQTQISVIGDRINKKYPIQNELKSQEQLNQGNQPQKQDQIKKDDKKNEQEKQNQQRKEDTKIVDKQNQNQPKSNTNQQFSQIYQSQVKINQQRSQIDDNQNPKVLPNSVNSQQQVKNISIKNNQIIPQDSLSKEKQEQIKNQMQKQIDSDLKIKYQQQQDQNPPIKQVPNQQKQQTNDQSSDQSLFDQQKYFIKNQEDVGQDKLKQNSDQNTQQNKSQIQNQQYKSQQISQITAKQINLYSLVIFINGYITQNYEIEKMIDFLRQVKYSLFKQLDDQNKKSLIFVKQIEDFKKNIKEQQLQQLLNKILYYLKNENSTTTSILVFKLPYEYFPEDQALITNILNINEF